MPTAQRTSVQQLTTTEAAVLALLAIEGERSGYDLMRAVTQAIGHIWSPARSGLYAALPRLVQLGLAHEPRRSRRRRGPTSSVYRITPRREGARSTRGSRPSSRARATRSSSSSSSAA